MPCYRCLSHDEKKHFASVDAECAGLGTVESRLGYLSRLRSTEHPRSLRSCVTPGGTFSHSLDAPCAVGSRAVEFLGFVK